MDKESEEEKLLKKFEEILNGDDCDDFGFFIPDNQISPSEKIKYPDSKDLKYPDEPPPIPDEVKCNHKNKKKVVISANLKFYICEDCKEDLGDAK